MTIRLSRRSAVAMLGSLLAARVYSQWDPAQRYGPPRATRRFEIGGAVLQVDIADGDLDLADDVIVRRIQTAAQAVVTYYGKFPVPRARVLIVPVPGRSGIVQGTTWGDVGGCSVFGIGAGRPTAALVAFPQRKATPSKSPQHTVLPKTLWPGFTRIRLGQHTTAQELADDWTTTHELVHMAFPTLPDDQHWMEEGLATYVEPIARVQAGELTAQKIWGDMLDGMPKGEPEPGDEGLDRTHTWGRTYWGGALFCLTADVQMRVATRNRKGLQDALRAIVAAGGTIDHEWPLLRALQVGDQATGTRVLEERYKADAATPSPVDLEKLWQQLGIRRSAGEVVFSASAPYAEIREAITGVES